MRKGLITASVLVAAFAISALADRGLYLGALGCIGWIGFVAYANLRKPRAATRGSEKKSATKILNFYDTTSTIRTQTKVWTPAGKAVIPMHYEE